MADPLRIGEEAMADIAAPAPVRVPSTRGVDLSAILLTLLLLAGSFFVVFPIWQILLQSFQSSAPGQPPNWSLSGWQAVFSERGLQAAAWNTITLTLVRQSIAIVLGVCVAWVLARTDLPGARVFEFLFWLAFFFPALTVTLSWILLLDPQFGLVNQLLKTTGLTGLGVGPLNVYSYFGIVWVQLMSTTLAVKVMLLTPAFRNMNASFEEASHTNGASTPRTFFRIFLPLMLPVILAVELLAILRSLEAFEVEQILGVRINLMVFSTWMYSSLNQDPPRYDAVSALAVMTILAALGLILVQRSILAGRRYTTITGRYQGNVVRLGPWRWPVSVGLVLLLVLIVGVPIVFSLMGTFMKLFGFFMADGWTLEHWQLALKDRLLIRSLVNTLFVAVGAAVASVVIHSLIAYILVRTRFYARGVVDVLSWLPFAVPGVVLGLGLITLFLQPQFRPIYGTHWALILALTIAGMPFGVQIVKSALMQLGEELEEASWTSGGNALQTARRVVLPLLSPTLVVVGLITFLSATRNVAQVALLSTPATQPLAVLQLNYLVEGRYEIASVLSVILLVLSLALAILVRRFGYRELST